MTRLIPGPREELCLDYANTLCWRGRTPPVEALSGVEDLLAWLARNVGWPPKEIAGAAPAADLFAAAIALRETIWRLFSALAETRPVADGDLATLADAVAAAPARRQLGRLATGFGWQVAADPVAPSAPLVLAPVLWSAADLLLAAPRHHRVRRCANDECLWLFLDNSKSGSRRWCDMASCGNRAKARRHYLKVTGSNA
jgi:predicted RNA-binding Zn ribbon-like protein